MASACASARTTADDPASTRYDSDPFRPTDIAKEPITIGDNPAHVEGVLYEVGRFYARKGLFQPLFRDRAVLLSNGKLALDSHQALVFLNQKLDSTAYGFDRPCPPTDSRIEKYDALATAAGTPPFDRVNVIRLPEGYKAQLKDQYVVQHHAVEKEDTQLLGSLLQIFESADKAAEFEEAAAGSGTKLLELMKAWGETATPKDLSLVTEERNAVIRNGIQGELNLESFNAYYLRFRRAERFVPPASRLPDSAVIQQLHSLMFRDPSIRDLWEITESLSLAEGTSSSSLDKVVSKIRGILRSRKVSHAIDDVTRNAGNPMLAVVDKDPVKDGGRGGDGKPKKFPEARDKTGKIVRWITGMAPCSCGGFHLFRDCPDKTDAKKGRGREKTGKPGADHKALAVTGDDGDYLDDDALTRELTAYFLSPDSELASDATISPVLVSLDAGTSPLAPPNKVITFKRTYGQDESLAFYAVNVGQCPGIYYGTWSDVAPIVHGQPARPGVTTHKRFSSERQALDHARRNGQRLENYRLTPTVPVRGGSPPGSKRPSPAPVPNVPLTLQAIQRGVDYHSPASANAGPTPTEMATSAANTAAAGAPASERIDSTQTENLSALELMELRAQLASQASRNRTTQYVLLGVIGLLLALTVMAVASATRAAPIYLSSSPQLEGPHGRLGLEAAYDDDAMPLIVKGAASATRGCAYVVLLALAASASLICDLSATMAAIHRFPDDFARVACLTGATPFFAASSDFMRRFNSAMPAGWKFTDCVRSASRLKGFTVCAVSFLLLFSATCFGLKGAFVGAAHHASAFRAYPLQCLSGAWHSGPSIDELALVGVSSVSIDKVLAAPGASCVHAVVDSGATASCTDSLLRLARIRTCDEIFGDAGGLLARAKKIGDLPVTARTSDGQVIDVTFTNVRYVPEYKFTLLSTTQLWNEQQFDARFADIRALILTKGADSSLSGLEFAEMPRIPYAENSKIPVITALCGALSKSQARRAHQALANILAQSGLGFHSPRATAHIGKLSSQHVGELMHRRLHSSVDKIRAIPHTSSDGTKNVASSPKYTCAHCAASWARRASHPGHLAPPTPAPGKLHVDIKGPFSRSLGGYLYAAFFIDETTRKVFFVPLKTKADIVAATKQVIAEFDATVGVPLDENGTPLERPRVREIRSDHEGGLQSAGFETFREEQSIHSSKSPPHDHDLNPIAESTIQVIDRLATAMRAECGAPIGFWAYLLRHAVDVHNSLRVGTGSAAGDDLLSPDHRFTLKLPRVMDLATFGCRSVVVKPPTHIRKGDLSSRGWIGCFLGRSHTSVGAYDVWVPDVNKVVTSSGVLVDEEYFPWKGKESAHVPLRPAPKAQSQNMPDSLQPVSGEQADVPAFGGPLSGITGAPGPSLSLLNLFSGPYDRANGLASLLRERGWSTVVQIDRDPVAGGGWEDDLMNDQTYARLLQQSKAGAYQAVMIAVDCSTFSVARFYSSPDGLDRGPLPVRTKEFPDGLPASELSPSQTAELSKANELLRRAVDVAIAAHNSAARATIIFENPADCSIAGTPVYSEQFKCHGSVFATSEFKRLAAGVGSHGYCTFAQCRFGSAAQKYTTLFFTSDAELN